MINPKRHYALEERRILSSFDERQRYAREEFAQWREANPELNGNMRDYASINELI